MPEQLTLDLPSRPAQGREAFFVAPSNALAVARLDQWRDWHGRRLVLCGPAGSGKSHLASVWAAETGARIIEAAALRPEDFATLAGPAHVVIEDAERIAGDIDRETALFHLFNHLQAAEGVLLITAQTPPARWGMRLPDLESRLTAQEVVSLEEPDDTLLAALMVKLFSDRQISVGSDLIEYLLARMPRRAVAAQALVEDLDALALRLKRPITTRLAATVLDNSPEDEA